MIEKTRVMIDDDNVNPVKTDRESLMCRVISQWHRSHRAAPCAISLSPVFSCRH